jgi:serine/threonine protein kinase
VALNRKEFIDELALLSRVRHPNIIQFLGVVTKSQSFIIVIEYLPKVLMFMPIASLISGFVSRTCFWIVVFGVQSFSTFWSLCLHQIYVSWRSIFIICMHL